MELKLLTTIMELYANAVQYIYIVLLIVAFLIIIGIRSSYFYFNCYLKKDIICIKFYTNTQTTIY